MDSSKRLDVPIAVRFGPGFRSQIGKPIDRSAYDQYLGVWSRLFVPSALAAAEITGGDRVLDVATGPGEAASLALAQVGSSGLVVGADISMAMLEAAQKRLVDERFQAVMTDGQALPFADGTFDAVLCQLIAAAASSIRSKITGVSDQALISEPPRCQRVRRGALRRGPRSANRCLGGLHNGFRVIAFVRTRQPSRRP